MLGHRQVAGIAGELVGPEHFDARDGAKIELVAPRGITLTVSLAARRRADGE